MQAPAKNDFNSMLAYSAALHLILLIVVFVAPNLFHRPMVDTASTSTMNVMWAETVTGPPPTAENKLPGPDIPLETSAPVESEKPRVTLDEKPTKKLTKAEIQKLEAEDRQKKMKEALAGLPTTKEERPAPKLDNYQSVEGAEKKGLPGSPFGGGLGKMTGDPEFAKFQNTVRKKILGNRVWIGAETNLHTEVAFKISVDGTVVNPSVSKSSGNAAYDNACLRAVLKSSPLPTPPEKFINQVLKEYFIIVFDPRMK